MNAYELAKAQQAYSPPTLEEIIKQQADRIAELEKQGEPVAWMNGNEICPEIGYEATITAEHPKNLGWIPLYTNPVKELTDELFDKIFADGKRLGVLETEDRFNRFLQTKPLSDEEIKIIATQNRTDLTIPAYISFARAIEERHGIK